VTFTNALETVILLLVVGIKFFGRDPRGLLD
jgi:hypothetical protein